MTNSQVQELQTYIKDFANSNSTMTASQFFLHVIQNCKINYQLNLETIVEFIQSLNLPKKLVKGVVHYDISSLDNIITEDVVMKAVSTLTAQGKQITKTNLKSELRKTYDISKFGDVFGKLNFIETGAYTLDNHKIYRFVAPGKHLSNTKGKEVDIKDMPKRYLVNAILDGYSSSKIENIFEGENELYQMLKAYFTYDVRQQLK